MGPEMLNRSLLIVFDATNNYKRKTINQYTWRRVRDSNPRGNFRHPTGLAIPPLQPLG